MEHYNYISAMKHMKRYRRMGRIKRLFVWI